MRIFSFFISLLLCASLVSCSRGGDEDAETILRAIMKEQSDLPAGVIYTDGAQEGDEGYMSPALTRALWGEDAEEGFAMLSDYAVYMSSFAAPYEIGVFIGYSSTDARRVEELCRARADIISVALRQTEFYSLCGNLRIVRRGRTVVFLMTSDPDGAVRLAKGLI